jgi:hypothetical protein
MPALYAAPGFPASGGAAVRHSRRPAARWHLPARPSARYVIAMNAHRLLTTSTAAKFAVGMAVLAAATGAAFASWLDHGPSIFMTMVENGLAWCF